MIPKLIILYHKLELSSDLFIMLNDKAFNS
jgi:hypothetical protein